MKKLCGLEFGKIKKDSKLLQNLSTNNYNYSIVNLNNKKTFNSKAINIGTIAIFVSDKNNAVIKINEKSYQISKYRYFDFRLKNLSISSSHKITFGIAGIKKKISKDIIKKFTEKNIYKVIKPWGYELWLNGEKSPYSFKKILIKKGNRTSLQYHKKKIETNYLFKGKAELVMSKKNGKNKINLILNNILTKKIKSGDYVNVKNYAVHRLRAITDIMLYEVSTPHLDDVIRISDDQKRNNGRISSEHRN